MPTMRNEEPMKNKQKRKRPKLILFWIWTLDVRTRVPWSSVHLISVKQTQLEIPDDETYPTHTTEHICNMSTLPIELKLLLALRRQIWSLEPICLLMASWWLRTEHS